MSGAIPDVLVLDDGELHGVRQALDALGVEFVHRKGRELAPGVIAGSALARRLLIATWKYAIQVTVPGGVEASCDEAPIRICVHHQDFLPMRRRMREMGVDYLLHTHVSGEVLQLLLMQLLHPGAERRAQGRLPLGLQATYRVGSEVQKGTLLELSEAAARIRVRHELSIGTELELYLPAELNQAGTPPIACRVTLSRSTRGEDPTLLLELLEPASDATLAIAEILAGDRLGTRITRLREAPHRERPPENPAGGVPETVTRSSEAAGGTGRESAGPDPETIPTQEDRRRNPRGEYQTEIQALSPTSTGVILGHDLSIEGMRVAPLEGLELGTRLTLALQRGGRRDPVVVDAEVAREDGDRGLWLRFTNLAAARAQELEVLICELPPILLLTDVVDERDPVVVSRWRGR